MAACVTNPTRTVYSTPVNVQTVTQTITTTITNPGAEVTQTFYSTSCLPYDIIGRNIRLPSAKFIRQVECPNGTTVYTSYSTSSGPPTFITSTEFNTNYVTNFGDPVAVETQFDTSCSNTQTTSTTTSTTTTTPQTSSTLSSSSSIFVPSPTPRPLPASSSASSTSSSASATQTHDDVVIGHKSHKTAAIAGGVVAGLLCLAIVVGAVFYFKFWKAGGGGKSGHHGHHGGEKTDIGGTTGGGGGGGGGTGVEHAPGHAGHHVPPTNYGGAGIETSGAGAGGGGAGGPAGAPGGGGGGMDTSAVAGGGYGGTAPPTSGLEGQFHTSTLPPGASAPAHHAYPVIVPVGARRREPGQAQQEMVNTVSTPWIDPAHQQQQSSYYYPQQQQPWQNADPYASATPGAHYPNSGPGWADPAYSSPYSQPGYNNGTPYPADPHMSQGGGYPTDPRASVGGGAYYPGSAPGHTSPNQNRTSVISSSPSSAGNPRASLLPYMNDYGAPQPGPSIAGTPAAPTSATESSADPFDKHAEAAAAASASAGPSDHDQPPPSYDEAGPSAQPFVPQDAKGRQ